MTLEHRYLVYSALLGLLHLLAAGYAISFQNGCRWTLGNREEPMPPLRGVVSRIDQAGINFLETFPFFAALVLVADGAGQNGALTLWGARLYFWSRVAYALAAVAGFSVWRSLIWNVAIAGLGLFIVALVWSGPA